MLARATPGRELVETAKASEESDSCRIKANGQNPRAFQLAPTRSLGRRPWRARRFLNSRGPTLGRGHGDAMMSRDAAFAERRQRWAATRHRKLRLALQSGRAFARI